MKNDGEQSVNKIWHEYILSQRRRCVFIWALWKNNALKRRVGIKREYRFRGLFLFQTDKREVAWLQDLRGVINPPEITVKLRTCRLPIRTNAIKWRGFGAWINDDQKTKDGLSHASSNFSRIKRQQIHVQRAKSFSDLWCVYLKFHSFHLFNFTTSQQ